MFPSRNGRVVKCTVLQHGGSWVRALAQGHRFEPRLRPQCHQCLWISLTAASMWVKVAQLPCWHRRSAGVAPEVNLRNSTQARKYASESTLALKPRADITRSPKQGYQWPHKKDMCPPKIKKKMFEHLHRLL